MMHCPFTRNGLGLGSPQNAAPDTLRTSPLPPTGSTENVDSPVTQDAVITPSNGEAVTPAPDGDYDAEHADSKRLNLRHLTKAVGTFVLMPTNFLRSAFRRLLVHLDSTLWIIVKSELYLNEEDFPLNPLSIGQAHYDFQGAEVIASCISCLSQKLGTAEPDLWRRLGQQFASLCYLEFPSALRCVGSTLQDFFGSLDCFHSHLSKAEEFRTSMWAPPFVRCIPGDFDQLDIQYATDAQRPMDIAAFLLGVIQQIASSVFSVDVTVDSVAISPDTKSNYVGAERNGSAVKTFLYRVSVNEKPGSPTYKTVIGKLLNRHPEKLSHDPRDLPVKPSAFCAAFPFHFMFDRNLQLQQMGVGLLRIFSSMLALREVQSGQQKSLQGMELKGQMHFCPESNLMIFIGSPVVEKLEELTGRGLYISDIPIHDATRDVILVGEQTKAQDGLKKRMDKLKTSIEEANRAVEDERQKNVDLLHLIFPPDVARKLWLGQTVEAETIDDVTMLFSDIVGFTAICGIATPMMVIDMLNRLYTRFDAETVKCDVYKLETIGDAFICVGGLHNRPAPWHAQQVAWMALKMMRHAKQEIAPDGNPIKMRIGLHTGSVLAGVVGIKMPRYCLFGNNVTIANKFESGSEPEKINVSPTTYPLLCKTRGFVMTARPRNCLPKGFPADIPGTCHFLELYKHPSVSVDKDGPEVDHIALGLKELNIGQQSAAGSQGRTNSHNQPHQGSNNAVPNSNGYA
ncbi:guanylate cyclase soluble subunit alpha-2-like isoform X2 [Paramacrobiotus metropolitanus]|uniref:guanylate cyclase soluble subunit alpha-2-like isoform X2 n=1 Tax=Paramacrobiotus metropolitanus TaxID=2943436 RepID=UPI002445EBA9|nr:guanylate cyclase soluble subunit alpha-2-like isoform X2 [Paramacrobiotus metropolitanus]